ncbi:bifunctional (p)ppGpp synthetase/guanosine-3',5'-bis(diphosphate) 3'-pyrophosphohydrolase [Candidatus Gottesmanbacteria bacterium]|nr:bifunctional (p)ppGpp synthetase/guanosine-3',5'-bis(diphosphate) 3'-pyrophosphohydrolase [Candidatus Gottesmanbacteria bacterium]
MNIIQKSVELAWKWHKNMTRKGDDSPYIIHPIMVATILAKNGFSEETIAAGYCHDLLEDTKCTEQEIKDVCGEKVLEIVKAVSNEDLKDWKEKKRRYIESVRKGPIEAKAVCCADKIHNLQSTFIAYPKYTPEAFWGKFNASKEGKEWFEEKVLIMLKETWNHPLISEYEKLLLESKKLK